MQEFKISSLRYNYAGNWSSGTSFSRDDIATYQGNTYVCQVPHTSTNSFVTDLATAVPVNGQNLNYWVLLLRGHVWQNVWQPAFNYFETNIVYYQGSLYTCTTSHLSSTLFDISKFTVYATLTNYSAMWMPSHVYGTGAVVKYGGIVYTCITAHTSKTFTAPTYLGLEADLSKWAVLVSGIEYLGDWAINTRYKLNDIVKLSSNLYICAEHHTSTSTFDTAKFDVYLEGQSFADIWNDQSTYQLGDVVRYGGYSYTSVTENNTGNTPSLDTTDWELLLRNFTVNGEWSANPLSDPIGQVPLGPYKVGAVVSYGGNIFVAIADNAAQNPTTANVAVTYTASGSSGNTLKVSSTLNIKIGMIINAVGFTRGQTVVNIIDINTIIINEAPDGVPVDGQSLIFTGVNYQYWSLLFPGVRWVGRWTSTTSYIIGDIVTRINATYRCIQDNTAIDPSTSPVGTPWVVHALHARYNVLAESGDLVTYINGAKAPLPIGTNNYLLKVVDSGLQYSNMMVTTNVFYVATNGYDSPNFGWGLTLDRPWKTIAYACNYVANGILNQNTAAILKGNKDWLTTEMYNFMVYSVANNLNGYTSSYVINQTLAVRDAEYIIDAIVYDITRGGNSQTVATAQSYFLAGSTNTFYSTLVAADVPYYLPALNYLKTLINGAINQIPAAQNYQDLNGIDILTQTLPSLGLPVAENGSPAVVDSLISMVITSLTNASTLNLPAANSGLTATIFIKTGTYSETLPISIPENIALVGDELRGVVIQPATPLDAASDMFRMRNGSGLRNMTLTGLTGTLTAQNEFLTQRPTGGSYVSLDPGAGPDDTTAWIFRKSPYVQNVSTFGTGCTGLKIDGSLHNGGNKSIVCNDFTQIISDGIGIWCTNSALCEAVSVFSYYAYAGYFSESGGRIRATNGNSSYGTFGCVAEGYDVNEVVGTGNIYNRFNQAAGSTVNAFGNIGYIARIQYSNAGSEYNTVNTNLLSYSNNFTSNSWVNDGNVSLLQNKTSPFDYADAWTISGTSSSVDTGYIYQSINITPAGGSFTNIPADILGIGAGINASFDIIITSTGYVVTKNITGSGYVVGNQLIILGAVFGGITGANDIIITVTGLTGSAIDTFTITGTIPVGSNASYTVSVYAKKATSSNFDIYAFFTGYGTKGSYVNYNFDTNTLTAGNNGDGGLTPSIGTRGAQSVGGGWYRVWFNVVDPTAANTALQLRIYSKPKNLASTGSTSFYGAQIERTPVTTSPNFYLESNNNRYSASANYRIRGTGTGIIPVGDEVRSRSVFQTKVSLTNLGEGYVTASNQSQGGTSKYVVLAQTDDGVPSTYQSMRAFITSGLGVGQYGIVGYYNVSTKRAYVMKESIPLVRITQTESSGNLISLDPTTNVDQLYLNQPIRFTPSYFSDIAYSTSSGTVTANATTGGQTNTILVSDITPLYINQPITFSGTVFGGVITNFTYYIKTISTLANTIQLSTILGGEVSFLNTDTGTMTINHPTNSGYIYSNTAAMSVNLEVTFAGTVFGGIIAGTIYYINDIVNVNNFTISNSLVQVTTTGASAITNQLSVDTTAALVPNNPLVFPVSVGGLAVNNRYYISNIISPTNFTVSESLTRIVVTSTQSVSNLVNMVSTANLIVGNPITFSGRSLGGIVPQQTYYVLNINTPTSITITSSYAQITTTVTETTISSNPTRPNELVTANTGNLVPLNAISFRSSSSGLAENSVYYISRIVDSTHFTVTTNIITATATATAGISNLITVDSTAGFKEGRPIIFTGVSFGGVSTFTTYYILAINGAPGVATTFTITNQIGNSAVVLTTATGVFTVKTSADDLALNATATGLSLVGTTIAYASPVNLSTGTGYMIARSTGVNKLLTLDTATVVGTSTSSIRVVLAATGTMKTQFASLVFGGINAANEYFIKSIVNGTPNKITITNTDSGLTTFTLSDANGNMQLGVSGWDNINPSNPPVNMDSTSTYFIEPRVTYSNPAAVSQSAITLPTLSGSYAYTGIAYGNRCFIAIGNGGTTIAQSPDGIAWNALTLPTNSIVSWSSIAYGNNYWIMIGNGSNVCLYSNSNGLSWKSSNLPAISSWTNITYGNGIFVAIARSTSNAAYSTDNGKTWTPASGLPNVTWTGLTYGKGIFVAVASGTITAARSTDGITWTAVTLPAPYSWTSIAYGGGKFVAVANTSTGPIYSFDGIVWNESPYSVMASAISYGQGVFVTVQNSNIAYTSEDAYFWKPTSITNASYSSIAFGFSADNIGIFVTTAGQSIGSKITAGCQTKARVLVASGVISEVLEFEPGSNYTSPPSISLTDPNAVTVPDFTIRTSNGVLSSPTFVSSGTGFINNSNSVKIWGDGYADEIPAKLTLVANNLIKQPSVGSNLVIAGDPTNYKITNVSNLNGTLPPALLAQLNVSPTLASQPTTGTAVSIRANYSQVRLTGHDFLYIGVGNKDSTDYPTVDSNNAAVQFQIFEVNTGRVFFTSTDQDGNFKVGNLFGVQQATGIVTISASQFGLQGLETLALGGIAVGGSSVIISQFSTDAAFVGNSDAIIPTQKAIKSYLGSRLTQGGSNGFTGNLVAGSVTIGNPNVIASIVPEGVQGSAVFMAPTVLFQGNSGYGQVDGDMIAYDFFIKSGSQRGDF